MKCASYHLPRKLAGDRTTFSLLISSSTFPSKQRALLLTLTSELALLLVARGESDTLIVLLLVGPDDRTLYIEDAGIFVIIGRRLPGMVRLISMCLIAISKDFFDSVLPKPVLSGDDDFPDKLLCGECLSSCLGGISFRIFITRSTIFVPYKPGLTLSLALA